MITPQAFHPATTLGRPHHLSIHQQNQPQHAMPQQNGHYDRVRAYSANAVNARIDQAISASLCRHGVTDQSIAQRLGELEAEWDIERVLAANAATLALTGVVLAATVDRRWLWLPGVVTGFLLQHALQGWCPPIPALRRLGVRTRQEIDTEKYALKALRGDFDDVRAAPDLARQARRAQEAAR